MTKLLHHRRFHIPNGLAIFAALLLLISTVAGFNVETEKNFSSHEATLSTKADSDASDVANDIGKPGSRGLNLGLLLFRRG